MFDELHASRMGIVLVGSPTSAALPALVNRTVLQPLDRNWRHRNHSADCNRRVELGGFVDDTDGQLLVITQAVVERYITASRQQGYKGPFVVSETQLDVGKMAQDVGTSNLDKVYACRISTRTAWIRELLSDMKKYQPNVNQNDLNAIGWLSVKTFAKVAATLSTIDRQSVSDAMSKQAALSTDGMTPVLNFTEPGNALGGKAPRLVAGVQFIYVDRYQDGQWKSYFKAEKPVPLFAAQ